MGKDNVNRNDFSNLQLWDRIQKAENEFQETTN